MKKTLLSLILTLVSLTTFAYSFEKDGIYYNITSSSDKTCEVTYNGSNSYSGAVVIPSFITYNSTTYTVTSIGEYAFSSCSGLTSVTIPNSVTSIGIFAFYGCSGLTSVTIPNSVTSIGGDAFYGCSGLTSVTIPNSVTSIGSGAFWDCSGLTSVTIPNSVTSIGIDAFRNCSGLTSVTIGNSVTSIGDFTFYGCSGLTSVTIPNSVTSIGIEAFRNCSSLTSMTIPNSVTSIGEGAFRNCSSLTSMTIPNSVTSIGKYAFYGCSGLTSVTIPNSVTSIGMCAFDGCSSLTKAEFSSIESLCKINFADYSANPLNYAHNLYIDGKEVKDLVIPNSVTSIGEYAFRNCSGLTSVTIPNSVTSIGHQAFYECFGLTKAEFASIESLCKINFDGFYYANPLYSAHNLYIDGKEVKDLVIPNSVTSIGKYAFAGCSGLTSVTIPNSVTSIGNEAFEGCSSLTKAEFSSIESLCKINFADYSANPLNYAHNLYIDSKEVKDLVIPNSVTSIGHQAFNSCSGLTSVTIPNSVTSIGSYAFYGCSGLTSVTIPNSVTSIGSNVFRNCSGLTSVTIPNSVTSIGSYAFYGCSGITDFVNLSSAPQSKAGSLPTTATVHVLKGCKSTYSTSSAWSGYNIVEDAEKFFPLENVAFEKEKMYVKMGSVFKLAPMIEPSSVPASNYDLIWMSSDPSVLYFDQSTQRFMAMKEGTATVTVTAIDANDNIKTAQVTVHVGDGIDPEESGDPQCEAPIVKYTNGNIICVSATDNAVCHYTYKITGEGEGTETGSSAGTALKIEITAYATADGYRQSKNTVKTFDYKVAGGSCDVNGDGKVTMEDANIVVNTFLGK